MKDVFPRFAVGFILAMAISSIFILSLMKQVDHKNRELLNLHNENQYLHEALDSACVYARSLEAHESPFGE